MIAATAFGSTAELREGDDGDFEFFGESLQPARNRRNFLRAVFETLAASGHKLEIIDYEQVKTALRLFQSARFRPHLANREARRVVDEERRVGEFFHGPNDFLHV